MRRRKETRERRKSHKDINEGGGYGETEGREGETVKKEQQPWLKEPNSKETVI